jgi:hypothetical protein
MTTETPVVDALETLDDRLRGELLRPGDEGYDEARTLWNARIGRTPAAMNFLTDEEGRDRIRAAYSDNYDRLAESKREWDPRTPSAGTGTSNRTRKPCAYRCRSRAWTDRDPRRVDGART